jgi:hypothetical protein
VCSHVRSSFDGVLWTTARAPLTAATVAATVGELFDLTDLTWSRERGPVMAQTAPQPGVSAQTKLARLFGLEGETWMRHANPLSVSSRSRCRSSG